MRQGSRFPLQLSAMIMATLLTSPHLAHYDMLIATLPAVLWLVAAKGAGVSDAPADAHRDLRLRGFKTLLAAGFIWLAVSSLVTRAIPIQLSSLLMLAWLIGVHRHTEHLDCSTARGTS